MLSNILNPWKQFLWVDPLYISLTHTLLYSSLVIYLVLFRNVGSNKRNTTVNRKGKAPDTIFLIHETSVAQV
jgi:hypothetical protein